MVSLQAIKLKCEPGVCVCVCIYNSISLMIMQFIFCATFPPPAFTPCSKLFVHMSVTEGLTQKEERERLQIPEARGA